jgi:predicted metal-dependent phosphoesterase TrpH
VKREDVKREDVKIFCLDLHVHTSASPDSLLTPAALLRACRKRGLDGVAVTDHNCLGSALALARLAPPDLLIIVGEEVRTAQGELLGLFLQEEIPPGQGAWPTAQAIRAQGGLVGVPHPGDRWRRGLPVEVQETLAWAGLLDFLEGRNGRVLRPGDNRRAEELGQRLGLPLTAGSDAHSPAEVGACSTLLPPFNGPQEFLAALRQAQLQGRPSAPWVHFTSVFARLRRRGEG